MHMDGVIHKIIICIFLLLPYTVYADNNNSGSLSKQEPLVLGVLPFRSPVALLKRFSPLRDYLQQQLDHPVTLETASNFEEFVMRSHSGRYDFLLTAPHFTLMALDSGKYELQATYLKPLSAAISVGRDSNIRRIEQLNGKIISTPPEVAIITMAGKQHLQKQQFTRKPTYVTYNSHNASIDAMLIGKADAAIASINPTRQHIENGAALRIITITQPLPGMGLLASLKLNKSLRQKYQSALINMHKVRNGKQALKKMGYSGYRKTQQKEFEATRVFLKK